jgi:hypothetical protein
MKPPYRFVGKTVSDIETKDGMKFGILLDFSDREFLVGHKYSRGLDVNYDRTSEEDRLQEYLKAMDLLTISPENRLRKELHDKDQIINQTLLEKDMQIRQLSKKMEIMEQHQKEQAEILKNLSPKKLQDIMNT